MSHRKYTNSDRPTFATNNENIHPNIPQEDSIK